MSIRGLRSRGPSPSAATTQPETNRPRNRRPGKGGRPTGGDSQTGVAKNNAAKNNAAKNNAAKNRAGQTDAAQTDAGQNTAGQAGGVRRKSPRAGRLSGLWRAVDPSQHPFDQVHGRRRWQWLLVDAVALLGMCALVGVANLPVYGSGWLWVTVLGGGLLGLLVGAASWRWRLNALATLVLLAVGWFVTGGLLAMPSDSRGHVLPTVRALHGLATGPVTAWRGMLTIDPPVGATWNLLCVPLLLALLAALGGTLVSLRTRHPDAAWLPAAAAIAGAWALGTDGSWHPWLVATLACALVLAWTSHRRSVLRGQLVSLGRRTAWAGIVLGAAVLGVAAAASAALAPLLGSASARASVRHVVAQPLEVNNYGSPLQQFRADITEHGSDSLFTISAVPDGAFVPVAVMDAYDGRSFTVTNSSMAGSAGGQFRRVGTRIARPDGVQGDATAQTVTIGSYSDVWVPLTGALTRFSFSGPRHVALGDRFYYNRTSATAIDTLGLRQGDSYTMDAVSTPQPDECSAPHVPAAAVAQPNAVTYDDLGRLAARWAGTASTAGERIEAVCRVLRTTGYFSHGVGRDDAASSPGHTIGRIKQLLNDPTQMVGDDEQYAVALALMARSLGIPSRVAYGFRVQDGFATGDRATALTQVHLEGFGWVQLDPTPPHDRVLKRITQLAQPPARPPIDTPLPPPKKEQQPPIDTEQAAQGSTPPSQRQPFNWPAVGAWTAVTGIPLVTIVLPLVAVLLLKRRRREARRTNPVIANRFAGAWAEVVDRARDLGRSPSPAATRSEQAERLAEQFPRVREELDPIALARRADAEVFGPGVAEPQDAVDYWGNTSRLQGGMRASVTWWRWVRSQVSVRSLRRYRD